MTAPARVIIGALACAFVVPAVRAESLYVVEQLVVTVSSEPEGGGERVATIRSGDRVELVQEEGEHSYIRLDGGEEGWVKSTYLSADLPLRNRLDQRSQELESAKKNVSRLQAELATARQALGEAEARAAEAVAAARAQAEAAAAVPSTPPPPPAVQERSLALFQSASSGRPLWQWVLGSAGVALLGGFALGWRMLDRRIRRKYGGLRIY